MEVRLMPFFQRFADTIMTGKEYEVFTHQSSSLAREKNPVGCFGRLIRAGKRIIVINYYMSAKLDTLFAMTVHIQRAGEPRDLETKALVECIQQVKDLEMEVGHEDGE